MARWYELRPAGACIVSTAASTRSAIPTSRRRHSASRRYSRADPARYWPAKRFAVELDTYETHGSHDSFEGDRLRQEDLKLVEIEMTRVTGHRLDREPRLVIERVTRLLAQRREQLRPLRP